MSTTEADCQFHTEYEPTCAECRYVLQARHDAKHEEESTLTGNMGGFKLIGYIHPVMADNPCGFLAVEVSTVRLSDSQAEVYVKLPEGASNEPS